MCNFSLEIMGGCPDEYIALFWETFFVSKKRGVSVRRHFPWVNDESDKHWSVVIKDKDKLVGGLVVKTERRLLHTGKEVNIALLGLVCVHPDYRGKGLFRKLMNKAESKIKSDAMDMIVLWTKQRKLYEKIGFCVQDSGLFGCVDIDTVCKGNRVLSLKSKDLEPPLSLPAFAIKGSILSYRNTQVIVVTDGVGDIVVRWKGDVLTAVEILKSNFRGVVRFNTYRGDALLEKIKLMGAAIRLEPLQLQMWKVLNSNLQLEQLVVGLRFDVLDRI